MSEIEDLLRRALERAVGTPIEVERALRTSRAIRALSILMNIGMIVFILAALGVPIWKIHIVVPKIVITPQQREQIAYVCGVLSILALLADTVISMIMTVSTEWYPPPSLVRALGGIMTVLGIMEVSVGRPAFAILIALGMGYILSVNYADRMVREVIGRSLEDFLKLVRSKEGRKELEKELRKLLLGEEGGEKEGG